MNERKQSAFLKKKKHSVFLITIWCLFGLRFGSFQKLKMIISHRKMDFLTYDLTFCHEQFIILKF